MRLTKYIVIEDNECKLMRHTLRLAYSLHLSVPHGVLYH